MIFILLIKTQTFKHSLIDCDVCGTAVDAPGWRCLPLLSDLQGESSNLLVLTPPVIIIIIIG